VKLQQTLNALNSKTAFYEEQINYYNTYIKTCLDNLTRKWVESSCLSIFHCILSGGESRC